MVPIRELARLLDPEERTSGASAIARSVGATQLCIFIRDPELDKFLPGPGFPQKFPDGMEWLQYIRRVANSGTAESWLPSPFSGTKATVHGFRLGENAIAVLFGDDVHPDAPELLGPGLDILAALLIQEVQTAQAKTRAMLAQEMAMESRQLAKSLSEAHDQIAASLEARESLLLEVEKKDKRLQLARTISGIGVWEFQPATGEIYLAPETASIYGMPTREFVGDIEELRSKIHPEDRPRIRKATELAGTGAGDLNVRFRVVWPNGVIRWVEERGTLLEPGKAKAAGDPLKVVGFSLDITQRVMTEDALIRSEKLAAAGRLAASIAHEINNPLESLTNLVYLAQTESEMGRIREILAMAEEELIRVSAVARTSLGFYRERTTAVRFDISTTVKEVLELFRKQIAAGGVQVRPELIAENAEVEGWPGEIKQTISNLLLNALHASGPSATIRIRVKRVRDRVQLVIADGGHGIGPTHLAHIFEPFYSTKKDSGTGLGLWVTRQIVEKHGGSIRVRSNIDTWRHGTVFLLDFLAADGQQLESSDRSLRYRWLDINA
ncbi:MAG: ATP-binding protein [Acidobacteriaceae bacterium]